MLPAAQAALEIAATILAGGMRAGKGMPSALSVQRWHRVDAQAGSTPACRHQDADFVQHDEARSRMWAPDAASVVFDAKKKCADSIETPMTPKTMSTACASARPTPIALCADGGSRAGAITLHDFKDSVRAVLDVVEV
ncbi:hypothetical protein [Trinickia acidisoli]|uniref:hypothetical protein n=1 Tax=Trinickia acidisoli TaxID=2767482 RepID=UPI001A8C603B|nr:hypothetical protein [Trinickia acidisoli]